MTSGWHMKNCKHCFSEINRRASVCPVCRNTVTFLGTINGFLVTVFPIMTAIVSLGFAFYEKYEKGLVQDTLAKTEVQLTVTEIQNEVAQEAIVSLSQPEIRPALPGRMMTAPPTGDSGQDVTAEPKTPNQILRQIERTVSDAKQHAIKDHQDLNKEELRELFRRKAELQSGRKIFRSTPGSQ